MNLKDLNIPKDWTGVTIGQFQELASFDKDADWVDRMVFNTSVLLDVDPVEIENLPLDEAKELFQRLSWSNLPPKVGPDHFDLENMRFVFMKELNRMSFGEWIDLEELCKKGNAVVNLHKILAIIYRPITETKDPYDSDKALRRAEQMKRATMADVYHAILFFFLFAAESTNSTKDYSWLETTWTPLMKGISAGISDRSLLEGLTSGDGTDGSTSSRRATS